MQTSYSRQYLGLWRRHWWWRSRHALVMRVVSTILSQRTPSAERPRILDIGCCGGVTFDDLSRFGDVSGIEADEDLATGIPRWAAHVEHVAFGHDYVSDQQYDLILMLDVLEHIEDDCGALEALRRLLEPGGAAIITVPALMSLWSAHDEANRHFRRYGRTQFQDLLNLAGFTVRELRFLFGWPLPLLYARRLLAHSAHEEYRVRVPPRPVNALFLALSRMEQWVANRLGLHPPIGSSLLAVIEPTSLECRAGSEVATTIDSRTTVEASS